MQTACRWSATRLARRNNMAVDGSAVTLTRFFRVSIQAACLSSLPRFQCLGGLANRQFPQGNQNRFLKDSF